MPKRKGFWDTQYKKPTHLTLSDDPSEDLIKFTRWLLREHGRKFLNVTTLALDLGCGNGRNLIYLAKEFGMRGVGIDTSHEAIAQAKAHVERNPGSTQLLRFEVRSITEPLPLPDASVTLVLDMMSSHVLLRAERITLRAEILRVLKPGGWLFFKSFLLDEDQNAARMLKENPGPEEGMYMHPEIGVAEYVWTEEGLCEFFAAPDRSLGEGGNHFIIHKIEKSFKHKHTDGSAWKRRTICAYLEKQG